MNRPDGTELRKVVSQVLSQVGNSSEARYYLNQFSVTDSLRFAVIKIGGAVLNNELEPLADALALLRNLGLMPIILHGAGPQLDQALSEAGIPTTRHNGLRITTPEVMEIARPVIYRINRHLVRALQARGVPAQGIQHGVFRCTLLDEEAYGLVGEVQHVELEAVRDVVRSGALPVVACLGETAAGQVTNVNADFAARELVWRVKPHKIIFLTDTGGLLDENGRLISAISLRNELADLRAQEWVHSGMLLKLDQIAHMLSELPESASVSITSVDNLATELFTHRGAGTLIRQGEEVIVETAINDALKQAIGRLLENSFGRVLKDDYFEKLPLECLLRTASNGAVAVVLKGVDGLPYLDKFAVTPEAQGAGLGSAVWKTLTNRFPRLYWRSRVDNHLTRWYYEQADASFSNEQWVAFSCGITEMNELIACRDDCFSREQTWTPHDRSPES